MGEIWSLDYTYTNNKVYKTTINLPGQYTEIISEQNLYGLGIDPVKDEVYVADAVAFQGNGKVYTFDFSGEKINEYSVGRGPRDFVFRNEQKDFERAQQQKNPKPIALKIEIQQ